MARKDRNGDAATGSAPGSRTPPDWDAPIPEVVGDLLGPIDGLRGRARLGRIRLELTTRHLDALDMLGRHPFLPVADLALVLSRRPSAVRRTVAELTELGLVRAVRGDEVDELARAAGLVELAPLELTRDGAQLAAAELGLTVGEAVRYLGFAGGGPERPFGPRAELVGDLAHTLGCHAFFVRMLQDAASASPGGVMVEWRSRSACRRGRLDPDGYAILQKGHQFHDFFWEYEPGATPDDALVAKFAAYRAYRDSGRFARDHADGLSARCRPTEPRFPQVLVLTEDEQTEERVAAAVGGADAGGGAPLPVLLTQVGLLKGGLAPWRGRR